MRSAVELSNVHNIVFVLEDSCFVVVNVEIVGCTEDCHHAREACCSRLAIHAIPGVLRFVSTNNGQKVVLFEEGTCCRIREEV
jgi:hypothetical protein